MSSRFVRIRLWAVLALALLGSVACTESLVVSDPPDSARSAARPSVASKPPSAAAGTAAPAEQVAVASTADATETLPSPTATATRVSARTLPTATPMVRRAQPAARPTATPTPGWPKDLVITEADIEAGASGDAMPGLQVQGLDVQFGNDSMVIAFDSLRYSFVSLRNVTVQGHFEVANGDVTFVADRIQPRNLATTAIPGFVNQALDQNLAGWYVESLSIEPGALVAKVRPR